MNAFASRASRRVFIFVSDENNAKRTHVLLGSNTYLSNLKVGRLSTPRPPAPNAASSRTKYRGELFPFGLLLRLSGPDPEARSELDPGVVPRGRNDPNSGLASLDCSNNLIYTEVNSFNSRVDTW